MFPKVSVIIPVYNVEKYLEECLGSILNQTYINIEVICIDDGSTDASLHILQRCASKDERVIVLTQKNLGAACARNLGMSIAKGEYLLFLDSDDVFHPDMIRKAIDKAEKFESDIVVFKAMSFDTVTGEKVALNDLFVSFPKYTDEVFSYLDVPNVIFNSFMVPAWNKLFR